MLPPPWSLPKDLYLSYKKIDNIRKEADDLYSNTNFDRVLVYQKEEEHHKALDKWYYNLTVAMMDAGVDVENKHIGGLRIDTKRKQVVFLDEYDAFACSLGKQNKHLKEAMLFIKGAKLQRIEPSDEYKDQLIEDIFKGRVLVT